MANERKLAKKAKSKKNKDRLVLFHTSNNDVESSASEFFLGKVLMADTTVENVDPDSMTLYMYHIFVSQVV